MNILSLPDEMLASVLKYTSFENLTEFRKVCSKIDSVARRYGLDKWKRDSLTISCCQREVWALVLEDRKDFTLPPSMDLLEVLKYMFAKIRGVKYLSLYNGINDKIISNEVGEFLLGNDCKNIDTLDLERWDISINFNTMRNIMTNLKLENLIIRSSFTEFEFSDALIEGIPFECLILRNKMGDCMKLSLPYLARLCALKIPRNLMCEIKNSSVTDLEGFFKKWTKDMMSAVKCWVIIMSKGRMPVDEPERDLSKLKCFEDCKVTKWNPVGRDTIAYNIESKINKSN